MVFSQGSDACRLPLTPNQTNSTHLHLDKSHLADLSLNQTKKACIKPLAFPQFTDRAQACHFSAVDIAMSMSNNFIIGFILLAFAAIAWLLIRYPAEQELKDWHAEREEKRKSKEVSEQDFYRTSPPSKPTRKSSRGFFISISFSIGALIFFVKHFLVTNH